MPSDDRKLVHLGNIARAVATNHFDIAPEDGHKIETDG
jgi:hypothetical protein